MSYTSELKRQQAAELLRQASEESSAEYASMFQAERQRLEAERQSALAAVEAWAEQARRPFQAFADGRLAFQGTVSVVDDTVVADRNAVRHWTLATPLNQAGIPVCHSSGQPEKCLVPQQSQTYGNCDQCRWHPRNMADKGERWYE